MTEDKGILIKNIYYMLTYAFQELKNNNYETIAGEEFDGVYDLFAEILFRGVSYQLKQGLHRRYIDYKDSLTTMRGKLDIYGTIRNMAACRNELVCEYDEYSEDNIFNRILKSTIKGLIKHPKIKNERKSALRGLLPFFGNISEANLNCIKWKSFRFDRNSRSYQMLMYICYFIAENLLLTTEAGQYKMQTFSDEHMCRLFEKFVLEYYKRHHRELKPCAKQISWNLTEDSSSDILPIMQTDIFLTVGERTLIIDTKYYSTSMAKNYDKHTIHSHNQYQIHSYVTNHDKKHTGKTDGMLLYAKTQEEIVPDGQITLADGNRLFYRTLDLNRDFNDIKSQLDSFIIV
ncbi:MAG: 5-methylcytosine-specific restriction endonuclease system specificity protein McrC [Muribaculaceae bacterium]|nr:5-methylcytosine-specific restriction endonuclease system specificity protein McrC [Muribaculaceae bacterium]